MAVTKSGRSVVAVRSVEASPRALDLFAERGGELGRDAQGRHPAQGDVRLVHRLAIKASVGESRRHRRQSNRSLQPGQRRAETEVRAMTESQVAHRFSIWLELV